MRNCCSRDLVDPAAHVRDFEPIWLDDYLDYLIVPNKDLAPDLGLPHVSASQLLEMVTRLLKEKGGTASSRDIGRYLQGKVVHGRDVLSQVKQRHVGLRAFFQTFSDEFEMFTPEGVEEPEFMVRLAESDADEQRQEARLMSYKGIAAEGEAEGEADDDDAGGGKGGKGGEGGATDAGWAGEVGWADAQRLGVTELRPLLRRLGLSASGRKAELLDRLGAEMEENGLLEADDRRSFEEAAGEAGEAAAVSPKQRSSCPACPPCDDCPPCPVSYCDYEDEAPCSFSGELSRGFSWGGICCNDALSQVDIRGVGRDIFWPPQVPNRSYSVESIVGPRHLTPGGCAAHGGLRGGPLVSDRWSSWMQASAVSKLVNSLTLSK